MTTHRFWSDDLDADLLKVVPGAADILGRVTAPLWTFGGTSHGRLNHPSVWGGQHGYEAYFGTDDTGSWKPGGYTPSHPLVACTWAEAARDAWVHTYVIVVGFVPIWNAARLGGAFMKLMADTRGHPRLPDGRADQLRGEVLASLTAATADLQRLVGAVA